MQIKSNQIISNKQLFVINVTNSSSLNFEKDIKLVKYNSIIVDNMNNNHNDNPFTSEDLDTREQRNTSCLACIVIIIVIVFLIIFSL